MAETEIKSINGRTLRDQTARDILFGTKSEDQEVVEKTIIPTWAVGKRIVEDGSIVNATDSFAASDEILIEDTEIKKLYGLCGNQGTGTPAVHYYDSTHKHIGYVYAEYEYDISADVAANNAKYIRLSHYNYQERTYDNVRVEFISSGQTVHTGGLCDTVAENTANIEGMKSQVDAEKSNQFVNILAGYNNCEIYKYLNNGETINHQNWCTLIDYVPVKPNTIYGIKFKEQFDAWLPVHVAYYDENKTYIDSVMHTNNEGYTTPDNCAFVRLAITNTSYDPNGHDDFSTAFMEEVPEGAQVVVVSNAEYNKNTYPLTTLSGKKWALFGDSITENNNRSGANYHDYIRAETGIVTINNAIGGSGYKSRDGGNFAYYQIALKTLDTWKDADVITIAGGINDLWWEVNERGLGTPTDVFAEPEDITTATSNTIMACFNKMLEYVIANAPNAKIGVIAPVPCYTTNQSGTEYREVPYDDECNMAKFVEACKKSCALHGIPYLDLFHNSGLRPWDSDFNAKYFKCISADSPDGLHPNELGHKWIYPMVREFLKTLI